MGGIRATGLCGVLCVVMAVGCGRVGFDAVPTGDSSDPGGDDTGSGDTGSGLALVETTSVWSPSMVTTQPLTLPTAPAVGSLVVVSVSTSFQVVTAVSDNAGNAYIGAPSNPTQNSQTYCNVFVFYARVVATTSGFTTSVTVQSSDYVTLAIHVLDGADANAPLAGDMRNAGNGSSPACGPVQSDVEGSVYLATLCHNTTLTTTFGAGFQITEAPTESGNNNSALATAFKLGAAVPTTMTASLSQNDNWQVILAAFRSPSS